MAEGDSFAQACAEKYNHIGLQASRTSIPTNMASGHHEYQAYSVLQITLLLPRCWMHSNSNWFSSIKAI